MSKFYQYISYKCLIYLILCVSFLKNAAAQNEYSLHTVIPLPGEQMQDLKCKNNKIFTADFSGDVKEYSEFGLLNTIKKSGTNLWEYSYSTLQISNSEDIYVHTYFGNYSFCGIGQFWPYERYFERTILNKNNVIRLFGYPYVSYYHPLPGPQGSNDIVPGPNSEDLIFNSVNKLVSTGERTLSLTPGGNGFITEHFIKGRGLDSSYRWKHIVSGPGRFSNGQICPDRNGAIRFILNPKDSLQVGTVKVAKAPNKNAVVNIDSAGNIGTISYMDRLNPNAKLIHIPNDGFLEYVHFDDTTYSPPKRQINMRRTSGNGSILWEKVVEKSNLSLNASEVFVDSLGVLLAVSQSRKLANGKYKMKYDIISMDHSGHVSMWDSSMSWSREVYYFNNDHTYNYYLSNSSNLDIGGLQRLSANKFSFFIVADSSFSFRNLNFNVPINSYQLNSSFIFILSKDSTSQPIYTFNKNFCGRDSIIFDLPIGDNVGLDTYELQLSDSVGSFINAIVLDTNTIPNFKARWPIGSPSSELYKFRIYSQNQQNVIFNLAGKISYRSSIPKPIVSALGNTTFCASKPVRLAGQSSMPFQWKSVYNNQYLESDTILAVSSDYFFAQSVFGGCMVTSDTIITNSINDFISIPSGLTKSICVKSDYINLSFNNQAGNWSGQYVDSANNVFRPGNEADTSIVYYKDHTRPQCLIDKSFEVIQRPIPQLQFMRDSVICLGKSIRLPNQNLLNTVWIRNYPYDTITNFIGIQTGNYSLTCKSNNGFCTASTNFSVFVLDSASSFCNRFDSLPEMATNLKLTLCAGEYGEVVIKNVNYQLGNGSYYHLELSNGVGDFTQLRQIGSSSNPIMYFQIPNNLPDGDQYQYRIRCSNPDTSFYFPNKYLKISKRPVMSNIGVLGPIDYCSNNLTLKTKFFATGSYPFEWKLGDSTWIADTIFPKFGKLYYACAINGVCRSNNVLSKSLTISQKENVLMTSPSTVCVPAPFFNLSANKYGVWSGPQVLNAGTSRFAPSQIDDTIKIRFVGNYGNGGACKFDTVFQIIQFKKPVIPQTLDISVCRNAGLYLLPYGTLTNLWTGNHIVDNQFFNPISSDGSDTLKVISGHVNCTSQGFLRIQVLDSASGPCINTSILAKENSEFHVFPNPTTEKIFMEGDMANISKSSFSFFNAAGKQVADINGLNALNGFDVHNFPNGLYILRIQNSSRVQTFKILKNSR